MQRIEVRPGIKYGKLNVIEEVASKNGKRQVKCKCDCGNETVVRLGHLTTGHSTTCGNCGIEYNGQKKTVSEWASLYGIKNSTLRARLKAGMSIGEALKTS